MSVEYRRDRERWGYRFNFRRKKFTKFIWQTAAEAETAEIVRRKEVKDNPPPFLPLPSGETVLYVIQRGLDGPIKVGISRRLKDRIAQLQNGSAEKLRVLRVYKMADIEKAIHDKLRKTGGLEGEWFSADLLEQIDGFLGRRQTFGLVERLKGNGYGHE